MSMMMCEAAIAAKREEVVKRLVERGVEAVVKEFNKNGIANYGIIVKAADGRSGVVHYLDDALSSDDVDFEALVERMLRMDAPREVLSVPERLKDRQWVLDHLMVRFQRTANDASACVREGFYPGSVMVLRVKDGEISTEVFNEILNLAGITEQEAWERATENTVKEVNIMSFADVIRNRYGMEITDEDEVPTMYVVSNEDCMFGAAAVMNTSVIAERIKTDGKKSGVEYDRMVCIPSSLHESLIVPIASGEEIREEFFTSMVEDVNCEQVDPQEQLADSIVVLPM